MAHSMSLLQEHSLLCQGRVIDDLGCFGYLRHDWECGCGPKVRPFERKYLWKLDESQKKLVNIESKSKWEECIDGIDFSGLRNLSR